MKLMVCISSIHGILTPWNRSSSSRATAPGSSTWRTPGSVVWSRDPTTDQPGLHRVAALLRSRDRSSFRVVRGALIRRAPASCGVGATSSIARSAVARRHRSCRCGTSAPPFTAEPAFGLPRTSGLISPSRGLVVALRDDGAASWSDCIRYCCWTECVRTIRVILSRTLERSPIAPMNPNPASNRSPQFLVESAATPGWRIRTRPSHEGRAPPPPIAGGRLAPPPRPRANVRLRRASAAMVNDILAAGPAKRHRGAASDTGRRRCRPRTRPEAPTPPDSYPMARPTSSHQPQAQESGSGIGSRAPSDRSRA